MRGYLKDLAARGADRRPLTPLQYGLIAASVAGAILGLAAVVGPEAPRLLANILAVLAQD